MNKISKNCKFCNKEFLTSLSETNRGNGIYCSVSCATRYSNLHRKSYKCYCNMCGVIFESKSRKGKYCSDKCKLRHYRLLSSTDKWLTDKCQKILLHSPCEVCGWNLGPRDVHHITPIVNGGKNEFSNLITLCPNCHRLAHRNLLSKDKLIKLVEIRTISSSSIKEEMDAKSGN